MGNRGSLLGGAGSAPLGGLAPGGPRPPAPLSRPLKTNSDKSILGRKSPDVQGFREYVETTSKLTLDLTLYDMQKMETVKLHLPYMHRWHPQYRNRTLAKFYKFNEWWDDQGRPPITLLTLTTYQDSRYAEVNHGSRVDLQEGFEILKASWDKLRMMLRNRILCRPFDYLWSMEPHLKWESGYPHLHVAIIGEFEPEQKTEVKTLWSGKYNAGSYDHGAQFSDSCLDAKGDINNAGFYLFKYLGKSFCIDPEKMTPGELRFNAILWEKGYRQWGSSRNISRAMRLDKGDSGRFRFLEAGVSTGGWETTFREASEEDLQSIREEINQRMEAGLL